MKAVLASLLASSAVSAGVPRGPTHRHLLIPDGWSNLRIVGGKGGKASGFIVVSENLLSTMCIGDVDLHYGMATGVCMEGVDVDGNVVGSTVTEFKSAEEDYLNFDQVMYASHDCSGTGEVVVNKVPTYCYTPGPPSTVGARYSYTTDLEPWNSYPSGLTIEFFDSNDSCLDTHYSSYIWYSPTACLPSTSGGSILFSKCDANTYTLMQYSDAHCTEFAAGVTALLPVCDATESGDNVSTQNFQSFMCNTTSA